MSSHDLHSVFDDIKPFKEKFKQIQQQFAQFAKEAQDCQQIAEEFQDFLTRWDYLQERMSPIPNSSTPAQEVITSSTSSPSASAKPSGPTAQNFKKAIMTQLGDPTKIKWALTCDIQDYEQPLLILVHHNVKFTLLPSTCGFSFSHMELESMVYDSDDEKSEQDESDGEEAGQPDASIPLPYWRIYREGIGYFAAPKNQQEKIGSADEPNDTVWVDDPSAGDTFLALGWLIAPASCGRDRITRYVCALNLSTDPVSM